MKKKTLGTGTETKTRKKNRVASNKNHASLEEQSPFENHKEGSTFLADWERSAGWKLTIG